MTEAEKYSLEQESLAFSLHYEAMHEKDYWIPEEMHNLIALKVSSDLDMMHYHQAIKAPDRKMFSDGMIKEVNNYIS